MVRDAQGRLVAGALNPGGRPRVIREFQKALQEQAYPKAIAALIGALESTDDRTRLAAAREVFDRLFGKPRESVTVTGEDGGPVAVDLRAGLIAAVSKLSEAK